VEHEQAGRPVARDGRRCGPDRLEPLARGARTQARDEPLQPPRVTIGDRVGRLAQARVRVEPQPGAMPTRRVAGDDERPDQDLVVAKHARDRAQTGRVRAPAERRGRARLEGAEHGEREVARPRGAQRGAPARDAALVECGVERRPPPGGRDDDDRRVDRAARSRGVGRRVVVDCPLLLQEVEHRLDVRAVGVRDGREHVGARPVAVDP
jgi:hypothetical protein